MRQIKLTEPQVQFLSELDNGSSISICVEPGNEFGELLGKNNFSGKIQQKSLFKLCKHGLILTDEIISYYGIRYFDCRLSDKGRGFLGGNHA